MSEHTQATVAQLQASLEHEAGVLSAELYNLEERRRELRRRLREIAAQQAVTKAAERELKQMTGRVEALEERAAQKAAIKAGQADAPGPGGGE